MLPPPPPDELAELHARASTGDPAAVARLLEVMRPALLRYCRARLARVADTASTADDVTQEVCVAVLAALPGYRDQGRPFSAFVFAIAANKVADALRTASRVPIPVAELPDTPDPDPGPEEAALRARQAASAQAMLDQLPDQAREILLLRVVAGLSVEEAAAVVGMTPGALRVAQHRALARLRTLLGAGAS
ncbi:MAG: RNA polymerase sigma factor ShbA [Mycobacteriales bacterium]